MLGILSPATQVRWATHYCNVMHFLDIHPIFLICACVYVGLSNIHSQTGGGDLEAENLHAGVTFYCSRYRMASFEFQGHLTMPSYFSVVHMYACVRVIDQSWKQGAHIPRIANSPGESVQGCIFILQQSCTHKFSNGGFQSKSTCALSWKTTLRHFCWHTECTV